MKTKVITALVATCVLLGLAAWSLGWAQAQSDEKMQPQWYTLQGNEMRASELIGTTVVNTANERVGEWKWVNDRSGSATGSSSTPDKRPVK